MGYYHSLQLAVILILWFVFSILKYFPGIKDWIIRCDVFYLIPTWNFFAPEPNQTDYYLYYRVFSDSLESPWRLVSFGAKREWYGFIWNPYRRHRKALFDLCQLLITTPSIQENDKIYSMSYLLLLNHVSGLCINEMADSIQFAIGQIVPVNKDQELSIAFISKSHILA